MAKRSRNHGDDTIVDTHESEEEITPRADINSPTSVKLAEVVSTHATVFSADELAVLNASVVELQAYEASLVVKDTTPVDGPPVNVDIPYVSQSGSQISCTMGNWDGEPDGYSYQWRVDGVDVPSAGQIYVGTPEEVGHEVTCVVTASNSYGSTMSPVSNAITVT